MNDDQRLIALRRSAQALVDAASEPITLGDYEAISTDYVILPARSLDWLKRALGPLDIERGEDWRFVWVDPGRQWGTPCIGGHRLPAEQIAEYVWAGDTPEYVAKTWDISVPQVLVACWYLARYHQGRTWRKRWGSWAEIAQEKLWSRDTQHECPMPPTKDGVTAAPASAGLDREG